MMIFLPGKLRLSWKVLPAAGVLAGCQPDPSSPKRPSSSSRRSRRDVQASDRDPTVPICCATTSGSLAGRRGLPLLTTLVTDKPSIAAALKEDLKNQ